jgi:predicted dehydrogenase
LINIGIVGYGYWGPNLVRNFAETPGANVVAVADLDSAKLALVQRRYPAVKTTKDFRDLLNDPKVDAIAIATPVTSHFELALAALRAGKHVWLEKPMAETSGQARQLIDEAERRSLVLLIDHTFIYTGAVAKMADLIQSGELGRVYYYDSTRVNLGLFQRDVSVVSDLAVHDFSILDHLFEERPIAVSGSGTNHFQAPLKTSRMSPCSTDRFIAHTNVSWLAPVKVRQILVGGSKKMIIYDDLEPSEKIKVYDKGVSFTDDPEKIQEMRVGYDPLTCGRPLAMAEHSAPKANISSTASPTEGAQDRRAARLAGGGTYRGGQPVDAAPGESVNIRSAEKSL